MKFYRVAFRDDTDAHRGYLWCGSMRAARDAGRKWRKGSKGYTVEVEKIFVPPSRCGIIGAFNKFAGHPSNG